jgi:hypothetical protein
VHLVDDVVDGSPQDVSAGGVVATGDCTVEAQPVELTADQPVDDVCERVASAGDVEQCSDVDVR